MTGNQAGQDMETSEMEKKTAKESIPRLHIAVSRQDLNVAVLRELGYDKPTEEQAEAISQIGFCFYKPN